MRGEKRCVSAGFEGNAVWPKHIVVDIARGGGVVRDAHHADGIGEGRGRGQRDVPGACRSRAAHHICFVMAWPAMAAALLQPAPRRRRYARLQVHLKAIAAMSMSLSRPGRRERSSRSWRSRNALSAWKRSRATAPGDGALLKYCGVAAD